MSRAFGFSRSERRTHLLVASLADFVAVSTCSPADTSNRGGPAETAVLPAEEGTDANVEQLTWAGTSPIRSFDPARGFDGGRGASSRPSSSHCSLPTPTARSPQHSPPSGPKSIRPTLS